MTPEAGARWPAVAEGPRRAWLAGLVAIGLAQALLAAVGGWCVQRALSAASAFATGATAVPLAGLAASTVVLYGLRALERREAQRLGQHFVGQVRGLLFEQLLASSPQRFAAGRRGALVQWLVGDLKALRLWVSLGIARCIVGAAASFGLLTLLALAQPRLAALVGLSAGTVLAAAAAAGPWVREAVREERRRASRLGSTLDERLHHLTRLLDGGRRERRRLRRLHRQHAAAAVRLSWRLALLRFSGELAVGAAVVALLAGGLRLVGEGALDALALVSWMTVAGMMLPALRETGLALAHLQGARVSRERVMEFLSVRPVPADGAATVAESRSEGVELVSVRLEAEGPPIDARIAPGQVAVLVADVPARARRLLEIVAGLAPPANGAVMLDGRPLSSWQGEALRGQVRYVGGDAPLWRGTLEYNLRYLAPRVAPEALQRAIRRCGLADWIACLPHGLATRVFDGGGNVAPERRFQVALAAAMLSRPRVLLIDDTRLAMDTAARQAVDEALTHFARRGGIVLRASTRTSVEDAAEPRIRIDLGTGAATGQRDHAWLH